MNTLKEDLAIAVGQGIKTTGEMALGGLIGTGVAALVVTAVHGVLFLKDKVSSK